MKYTFSLFVLSLILFSCTSKEFYVSPSGDDNHPGSRKQPFATLGRAREAVRQTLAGNHSGNITVWLNDGVYPLGRPLQFGPEDSGPGEKMVRYKAVPGSRPLLSGGVAITDWKKAGDKVWVAGVPDEVRETGFRELFKEGKRLVRARHPNAGYHRIAAAGADRRTNFTFHPEDIPALERPAGVELVLLHDWSISRIPVAKIDYTDSRLTAVDSIGAKAIGFFNLDHWEKDPRYFLENAREFLDAPGEWWFDSESGMVYLYPEDGQDPGKSGIVVPATGPHLITITGTEDQKVRNLSFEGISFEYCSWQIPVNGYAGIQACHFDPRPSGSKWSVVPAAADLQWAENCHFINCRFAGLGGSGISLGTGCRNCSITGSHLEDISGNGIMVGEGRDRKVNGQPWWQTVPEQVADGNSVLNNTVTECGRQFYGAVGIWCGLTANTRVNGNHVFHLPYTGISIGWEWSPTPTPCRNNQLSDNHIHQIMEILSDGGGIYMLGLQPGSTISGNLIHDVTVNAGRAESNGMFLDEGTTDVTVSGNIIYNIAKSPLRFHRATVNLVKDNVLSCGTDIPPVRYNNTKKEDIKLENNLVLQDSDPADRKTLEEAVSRWKERMGGK